MKCKKCKFFDDSKNNSYAGENVGNCTNENFVYIVDREIPNKGLGYIDCESYGADFHVNENFGCVNFERK